MSVPLLLDEHYSARIAGRLRDDAHDVVAVLEVPELRAQPDDVLFRWAAMRARRIVTENIRDFRPLLVDAYASDEPPAQLLLVPPTRFPRGGGSRDEAIARALSTWLAQPDVASRPDEDWLI